MRTTDFGDDKDRVLIRSNGELTYFASDTAYYLNKRARGFDHCIYLLGADHHGYVGRLRAMAACVGDDPDQTLDVMIGQLVKIMRDGEELQLSKRAGTIVTLNELADEIGVDALRYSLARYPADSPADPRRRRDHQGVERQPGLLRAVRPRPDLPDDGERRRPRDVAARRRLRPVAARPRARRPSCCGRWPSTRGWSPAPPSCASRTAIARYLEDTAAVFNKWYDTKECRMLPQGDEPVDPTNEARLVLVVADADGARQRPRPARRLRARADVRRAHLAPVRLGAR